MKKVALVSLIAGMAVMLVGCGSEPNADDLVPKSEKGQPQLMGTEKAAGGSGGGEAPLPETATAQ